MYRHEKTWRLHRAGVKFRIHISNIKIARVYAIRTPHRRIEISVTAERDKAKAARREAIIASHGKLLLLIPLFRFAYASARRISL